MNSLQLMLLLLLFFFYPTRGLIAIGKHSLNISSEATGPIEAKFHMESPWDVGTKVCSNGPGHMTKMAAMPRYSKNLKHLLRNQKADDLETWCAASGARVPPSFK